MRHIYHRSATIALSALVISACIVLFSCASPLDPAPTGSFSVNGGDRYAFSSAVTLNSAIANATAMRFRNNGGAWSDWEAYAPARDWTLPARPGFDHVFAEYRSAAGTVTALRDSISSLTESTLAAPDGAMDDRYSGYNNIGIHSSSVALSADGLSMLVGFWEHNLGIYRNVWTGSTWDCARFQPFGPLAGNRIGFSTYSSADGNVIAVSGLECPTLYTYRWTGGAWQENKIQGPTSGTAGYGVSLALSGDGNVLVVGSYRSTASLYIYEWDGSAWKETVISPTNGSANFNAGFHVAVASDGNTVACGAPGDLSSKGSVYVYARTGATWTESKLTASDGASEFFGRYVSLSSNGSVLATGAYRTTVSGNAQQGRTYVYTRDGSAWNESTIDAPYSQGYGYFGYFTSLAGDGAALLVGAPGRIVDGRQFQGAAYLYTRSDGAWTLAKEFTASNGSADDFFAYHGAISLDGSTIAIGSPGKDLGPVTNQGCVYQY